MGLNALADSFLPQSEKNVGLKGLISTGLSVNSPVILCVAVLTVVCLRRQRTLYPCLLHRTLLVCRILPHLTHACSQVRSCSPCMVLLANGNAFGRICLSVLGALLYSKLT